MDFQLSEEQRLVRDTARAFADRVLRPAAAELDREERFPTEFCKELQTLGLFGVNVPAAHGGSEAGVVAYAVAMMEISRGCASTAVTMAVSNMVAEIICKFGSPAQIAEHVTAITGGGYVAAAFALSEPGAGSDAVALATTAKRRPGGGWVLEGAKQWITSGDVAGVIVVWARTGGGGSRGISCFLVPGGAKGMRVGKHEDKMGLRASTTVPLVFEDCVLPDEALLAEEGAGFRIAMTALNGGRIGIASQAVGIATAAIEEATRYALERRQFDRPIADFQAIQFMLADSKAEIDAARLLALRAAWLKERGEEFKRESAVAKLYASEAANRACHRAVQIHGGYGYTREYAAERHLRDVRVTTIYEGTSEVQRIVIAREHLGPTR